MKYTASAFVFLALFLWGIPSEAQESAAQKRSWEEEASSYFVLEEVLMRGSDDPALESPLAAPQPRLTLETKDGNTVLKGRIGMEMQKKYILDLQVASPTNQSGDKVTTLASLDGLSNGGSAEVGFTWVLWPDDMEETAKTMLDEARQELSELGQQPETAGAQRGMAMRLYNNPGTSFATRPSAVAALGPTLYDQTVERARERMKGYTPKFLTARATVGQQEFHFVDETTLKADDQTHADHKLTA